MRTRRARFLGSTSSQGDAANLVKDPGDVALVHRGVARAAVIQCPDGCGETLTINLDPRVGDAWRIYVEDDEVTLFPSVWRTSGCKSHFILWSNRLYWNDRFEGPPKVASVSDLEEMIFEDLKSGDHRSPLQIADAIDALPWAVQYVCRMMVRDGKLIEGDGELEGRYRRT